MILAILVVLGVHSCQVSATENALKDYNDNVSSLIQQSEQTSATLFHQLTESSGASATNLYNQINETRVQAQSQLSHAEGMSVPDQMRSAQVNLVLALQMRRDGIAQIASNIEQALGNSATAGAVSSIAVAMGKFYASDVMYISYTTPLIASALHGAGIDVGGASGETIQGGQFLPNIDWVSPSYVASQLHVAAPSTGPGGKPAPGLHGHTLNSVSFNGNTLSSSGNNVPGSPPPAFTLNITNGGHFTETDVGCKVSVSGTSISGKTTIPQTTAGQTTSCTVTLNGSPPAGTYTVNFEVVPVPGEKNTSNNSLSYPITFG